MPVYGSTQTWSRSDSWSPQREDYREPRETTNRVPAESWTPLESWSGHFDVRQEIESWPSPSGGSRAKAKSNNKWYPSRAEGRNSPHHMRHRQQLQSGYGEREYQQQSNRWDARQHYMSEEDEEVGDGFIEPTRRRRPISRQRSEFDQLYGYWEDDERLAPRSTSFSPSNYEPYPSERWHPDSRDEWQDHGFNNSRDIDSYANNYNSRDVDSYERWSGVRRRLPTSIGGWSNDPNNPYRRQDRDRGNYHEPNRNSGWMRKGDRLVREIKGSVSPRDKYGFDGDSWRGSTITSDPRDPFKSWPRRKAGPPSESSTLTESSRRGFGLFKSGMSVGSRFSRSSRNSRNSMGKISVLTEDRSAEVAAAELVDKLRSEGFQLRGDGTILSTGSSACRKDDKYAKDAQGIDDLEDTNEQLRGSNSVEDGERYTFNPREEKNEQSTYTDTLHKLDSSVEGGTRNELRKLSYMNSLIDDSLSTTDRGTYDNSTISTRDTKSTEKKIAISMSKLKDGNKKDEEGTKSANTEEDNSMTVSTIPSTLVSKKQLTWGGEMPPLTSSGTRVPETVSKDPKNAIQEDFSDLSSGPTASIATSVQPADPMGRVMDQLLLALRLAVVQPCGKE